MIDRHRREDEKKEELKQREYNRILNGKLASRKDWLYYHTLPQKLTPIAQNFHDPHVATQKEKNLFLSKDEYTSMYLQLARTLKDDVVFGKPQLKLYFKTIKPEDLNDEFGWVRTKPFKCVY